MNRQINK